MDREKYKKVEMGGAKKFFLILISVSFHVAGYAQFTNGLYKVKSDNPLVYHSINCIDGHRFLEKQSHQMNHVTYISRGYYLLSSDSLYMFYDSIPYPIPNSRFEVLSQKKMSLEGNYTYLSMEIYDSENRRINYAVQINMMRGEEALHVGLSDENGKYTLITQGTHAEYVLVDFVSYQTLRIDLAPLRGTRSKLKVVLEDEVQGKKYNQKYRIDKYRIKSLKKNRVELLDHNGKEVVWLRQEEKTK